MSGRECLVVAQPVDALSREVLGQVVFRIVRRLDRVGILEQPRLPLGRLAGKKSVEIVEAMPVGQRSNGPIDVVWLAGVLCHLPNAAVLYPYWCKHLRDRRRLLRDDAGIAIEVHRALGDGARADALVVAPGQQRGARRRADRSGMERTVADALMREPLSVGVWISPPNVSARPKPTSSSRTIRMLGAPTRSWFGSRAAGAPKSCNLCPATLAEGSGGNGSTDPSPGRRFARVAQSRH